MAVYVLAAVAIALLALVWWRWTSVGRGARQRDEKILQLLDPLGERLEKKERIPPGEVADLAAKPHVRPLLYAMLTHFERLDLFPARYLDTASQGEAELAYWLMHPNELQDAPEQIELVESIVTALGDEGERGEFLVFRYTMRQGHWAAKDGWLLGVAGPYSQDDVPYSGAGAFSRAGDKYGEVGPNELVDWYIGLLSRKRTRE